jgi:hypothetical protein
MGRKCTGKAKRGAHEFLGIFREMCALALRSCRLLTTLHAPGDSAHAPACSRTRQLDDDHRNLHEAHGNQRE